jgi:predicted MPP superfamily phosphohydrolase
VTAAAAGSGCVATQVMRFGFAAAGCVGVVQALFARWVSGFWRVAAGVFLLNAVVSDWALCALTASFVCSGNDGRGGSSWIRAVPFLVLCAVSTGHTAVITRGKLMPLLYRGSFAVAYSVLTTASLMIFLFTPAIAMVSNSFVAAVPIVIAALFSLCGVHQSWSSPRPLHAWELVELDLNYAAVDNTASEICSVCVPRRRLGDAVAAALDECTNHQHSSSQAALSTETTKALGWCSSEPEELQWLRRVGGSALQLGRDSTVGGVVGPQAASSTVADFLTVFQITDPHLGSFMTPERLRTCCERALRLEPDVILLTGDFYTAEAHEEPTALEEALAPLAQLPRGRVFACFGNHDLETPRVRELVHRTMKNIGAILLCDEATVVRTRAGLVEIIGLDYTLPRSNYLQSAIETVLSVREEATGRPLHGGTRYVNECDLGKIGTFGLYDTTPPSPLPSHALPSSLEHQTPRVGHIRQTLVLLHDPQGFRFIPRIASPPPGGSEPARSGALVFSGHTHGGHIGLFNLGLQHATLMSMVGLCDNGVWRHHGTGNVSYIHRGQGARSLMSQAIVRLGVPSEDSILRVKLPPLRVGSW